ncbi:MAG: DEAD/DEAH box helicase [Treponema sp.]|jgi:ATP-dependent RNA helicase DeaD|nr:DEAD/DEAH box helicase [Treponema sp.]
MTDIDITHPFASFDLSPGILDALTRKGFTVPTSIQSIALPRLLAGEGHLIVKARTGTGKTAAFGIPLIERFIRDGLAPGHSPRALILTPTRELALQVSLEIASFIPSDETGAEKTAPRIAAVYGGASIRNQIIELKRGVEIVVGTPGRVMDLMERKVLDLSDVDWFILDEADEMLDMGFLEDVEMILSAAKSVRRIALFSATMPEAILRVVREYIGDAEILEDRVTVDEKPAVDQFYLVLRREDRLEALRRLIDGAEEFYGLVFCATKAGADELARRLLDAGYAAEVIHGDRSQEERERTLRRFRAYRAVSGGDAAILVATDVAARGIDIERLTHVINWDFPNDRESYVHRIGRTGRAGRRGKAVSLVLPAEQGRVGHFSRSMERVLGSRIEWMRIPPVKSVLKARERRILAAILAAIPEQAGEGGTLPDTAAAKVREDAGPGETALPAAPLSETAPETAVLPVNPPETPFPDVRLSRLSRKLIERLGAEGAVEALITAAYGEQLDSGRYGPVTEFPEPGAWEAGEGRRRGRRGMDRGDPGGRAKPAGSRSPGHGRFHHGEAFAGEGRGGEDRPARVYVGLGRRHGATARDVAGLLMRAGGVPGRLVDSIEMKDYCAFATMPRDAAKRACEFSRGAPQDPVIRPASPAR